MFNWKFPGQPVSKQTSALLVTKLGFLLVVMLENSKLVFIITQTKIDFDQILSEEIMNKIYVSYICFILKT